MLNKYGMFTRYLVQVVAGCGDQRVGDVGIGPYSIVILSQDN